MTPKMRGKESSDFALDTRQEEISEIRESVVKLMRYSV